MISRRPSSNSLYKSRNYQSPSSLGMEPQTVKARPIISMKYNLTTMSMAILLLQQQLLSQRNNLRQQKSQLVFEVVVMVEVWANLRRPAAAELLWVTKGKSSKLMKKKMKKNQFNRVSKTYINTTYYTLLITKSIHYSSSKSEVNNWWWWWPAKRHSKTSTNNYYTQTKHILTTFIAFILKENKFLSRFKK